MTPLSDLELFERLSLAAALGGVLGLEREWHHKTAGLRTNILIAMGAALFTLMSMNLTGASGDPSRVAAQIVTGIGFLGAGAILRTNAGVQGLTTAAAIWVNAAIGVTVGGGEYHLAFIATGVTLVVLAVLPLLERIVERQSDKFKPEKGVHNGQRDATE